MRLRTKKTWSHHQLAVKLRVEGGGEKGILSFERRRLLIHAAKTAFAAALCWWLALRFGLHDGYWGSISAIIVMQSNVGATVTASRDRLLGTFIGALFGFAFSLFGAPPWNYILAVFLAIVVSGLLGCATVRAWPASPSPSSCWFPVRLRAGAWRSIASGEVLLGIVVALAVTTLVLPDRARLWLRDGLAQEFLLLGAFFAAILDGLSWCALAKSVLAARRRCRPCCAATVSCLDAARNEPGGPGWREGLSLLSQFGRSLFDALLALEFAVKDSHEDRFAQQLEPALTHLADRHSLRFQLHGRLHSPLALQHAGRRHPSRAGHCRS